jgi:alpha-1,6-mannosyltransferase
MSRGTLRHTLAGYTPGALAPRARQALGANWRQLAAIDRPAPPRRVALAELGVLALLGLGLVALALWLAQLPSVPAHPQRFLIVLVAQLALYGLAAAWVWWRHVPVRAALAIIVLVAVAARLAFAMQAPTISDDIYRYVWDGRVQAAGMNPYRYAPDDPALAPYRDEAIFPHINRRAVPTIYPPVAQGVFRLVYALHPASVAWTRIAFAGFDLATILALIGLLLRLGLRPERVILYAWHPLLILELGHSGHVDVVAICFLVLALRARLGARPWQAGFLLACATLTKFYALIALPALLDPRRRRDLRLPLACAVTAALAYLPFLSVGGKVFGYLGGYVQEEGIASGDRYYLLGLARSVWSRLPVALHRPTWTLLPDAAQLYSGLLVLAMGALALWCWLRPLPSPRAIPARALLLFSVFIACTTPTYPWYALLLLPFIPLVGPRLLVPALAIVSGAGFLYLQWWWPGTGGWSRALAYGLGPFLLVLAALVGLARGRYPRAAPDGARQETGPTSLFERFPWIYSSCREWFFRDHTGQIVAALWPNGAPDAHASFLEIGCGPGFYARRLARRFGGLRVIGLDRSAAQLGHARQRATAQGLTNCRFVEGDARALRQRSGSIDTIVASRLFTVLPERECALAEMYRVLGSGGRCFIAEPRSRFWTALPLRALWLAAVVARALRGERLSYREPTRATVLTTEEFAALVSSQPWQTIARWHDRQYHYAVCEKGCAVSATLALAPAAD